MFRCLTCRLALTIGSLTLLVSSPSSAQPPTEQLPTEQYLGQLEVVARFQDDMPTGVTVSQNGRIFVNFPRWEEGVELTVVEIVDGQPQAYPNETINQYETLSDVERFISVQSVVVDPQNRLWVLDTGRPQFQPAKPGGPKLVAIDLETNQVLQTIVFPANVALPTTYLNDVRFDLRGGRGVAYITDSSSEGPNGIIVVDLNSATSWRRLHNHPSTRPEEQFLPIVEGRPLLETSETGMRQHLKIGSDGIALSADGQRLFYCPLSSRRLYSVSTDALLNREQQDDQVASTVQDHGDRGFASDGLEADAAGAVYLTNYEDNAVLRRNAEGSYETLAHHPTMLWPDTLSLASDGHLYMICNQLHRQPRFQGGQDRRERPFLLLRTPVDAQPVLLR